MTRTLQILLVILAMALAFAAGMVLARASLLGIHPPF